jgi:rhodanese-related sulfurtransferase
MKPKVIVWLVVALAAVGLGTLVLKPAGGAGLVNVDAAGVTSAMSAGAQAIDVRTAGEFQMGHIPGAVNVPLDQFEAQAATWDKNATYVVYCASGARSQTAVGIMQKLGFTGIKHFNAGIQAWSGELEKGDAAGSTGKIDTNGKPVFIEFFTNS